MSIIVEKHLEKIKEEFLKKYDTAIKTLNPVFYISFDNRLQNDHKKYISNNMKEFCKDYEMYVYFDPNYLEFEAEVKKTKKEEIKEEQKEIKEQEYIQIISGIGVVLIFLNVFYKLYNL